MSARPPTRWSTLATRIRTGLGYLGWWPARTEYSLWFAQLARHIAEARHSDREYDEIVQLRRERAEQCRSRGDVAGVAAEAWALVGIAAAVPRPDDARDWMEVALDVLADASGPVIEGALRCIETVVFLDLAAHRFRSAEQLCLRAAQEFAAIGHAGGRFLAAAHLAYTQALAWQHEKALQSCEVAYELAYGLRRPNASPYRDSARPLDADDLAHSQWLRDATVTLVMAKVYALIGLCDCDAAETALRDAAAMLPAGFPAQEEAVRLLFARAFIASRQGRYSDAAHCYREAGTQGAAVGYTRLALLRLGEIQLETGALDDAAAAAKRLLATDLADPDAACLRAAAELAGGRPADAELWARRADDPRAHPFARAEAARIVGEVELARGELDAALASAKRAVALLSDFAGEGDMRCSQVLVTLARVESARAGACVDARFEQALALRMSDTHPRRSAAMLAFADELLHDGREREANDLRDRAAAITAAV